jgi:AcrR family transcriptional regulator
MGARVKTTTAVKAKKKAPVAEPLCFAEYLDQQAAGMLTKGERTRYHFKAAAARILGDKGYHSMQMSDICNEVGLSQGAIYKYFSNKREIAVEVMTEFIDRIPVLLLAVEPEGDDYSRTYQVNLQYVRIFANNVGLMRCMRQLSDELEEFAHLWHSRNAQWWELIAKSIARRSGNPPGGPEALMLLARSLAGMVEEFLHDVYVRGNPDLAELADSPEKLAETISILWYRQAFAANPPSDRLRRKHPLLKVGAKRDGE